jgi:hypothetical protein
MDRVQVDRSHIDQLVWVGCQVDHLHHKEAVGWAWASWVLQRWVPQIKAEVEAYLVSTDKLFMLIVFVN